MTSRDFQEISHSGGKITFTIRTDANGVGSYQVGIRSSRPVPMAMIALYALPQGIPVASIRLGGIGDAWNPPPFPGCLPVLIQSDSEGRFGYHCPRCERYWRSEPWPKVCPYCNCRAEGYQFLSKAQQRFVAHYCAVLNKAMQEIDNGEVVIDMDEVADAVGKEAAERPKFYVSEESQQHKFTCPACGSFNDILGRFGYCSHCGTRHDLELFVNQTMFAIRERLRAGAAPHDCVRDAVAAFDTFAAQYAKQLAEQVPLSARRVARLTNNSFHDLDEFLPIFLDWFDIDLADGLKDSEVAHVKLMFHRRHLYEHNGGEVDERYLAKSGDTSVRLKQLIRENQEDTHALIGSLLKMARNLHGGFHMLVEVEQAPIRIFEEQRRRMADAKAGR